MKTIAIFERDLILTLNIWEVECCENVIKYYATTVELRPLWLLVGSVTVIGKAARSGAVCVSSRSRLLSFVNGEK